MRALDLAQLGTEIALHVDAAAHGEARVNDLRARAWAGLGNAQRIRADFREAEESFAKAERLLKKGTGDPLEKANVLLLKSSLRGSQQRFREAFRWSAMRGLQPASSLPTLRRMDSSTSGGVGRSIVADHSCPRGADERRYWTSVAFATTAPS